MQQNTSIICLWLQYFMLLKSYDLPYKDFKFETLYIESNNDK